MDSYISEKIAASDDEDAKEELEELLNEVILQTGKFNRLQKNIDKGTIAKEESDLEMNKLRAALLNLANNIKGVG